MQFEEVASINSELRYLTLELMKLAAEEGKSFDEIMEEFIANTYLLKNKLESSPAKLKTPRRFLIRR